MKLISVVTPCYNEEENVRELYQQVKNVFAGLSNYRYEHIFMDNASKDRTVSILKEIAKRDKNVKIIVNARNFGNIRSHFNGMLQAKGDAVISMAADFQEPPQMIVDFIKKWEEGYKKVVGVKIGSKESFLMFTIRKMYYRTISRLSDIELIKDSTGFGIYDKRIMEILREIKDPYPYFRGLTADIGFETARIEYVQPSRKRGITKNNFYVLYDMAMLGIINHSKVPLRLATMLGFSMSALSLFVAFGYFIYKVIYWESFTVGIAPIVIGLFFFSSVQLFFLGIVGEYISSIHTQVLRRPLVVEKERINFEN